MKKEKDKEVMLSIHPDHLKNKHYDLTLYALGAVSGYVDTELNKRVVDKREFNAAVQTNLKLDARKRKKLMNTLIELNLIEEDSDNYYWNPMNNFFVKLKVNTVIYCLDVLSSNAFKVYCYLLNKQNYHDGKKIRENYFFSRTELVEACGYAVNNRNRVMINNILVSLEELGLISYNHEGITRPGSRGTYLELYSVSLEGRTQKKAEKELPNVYHRPLRSYEKITD